MQFIEDAFGSNVVKTRNPQRKFVTKAYFQEINRYTKLIDSRSGQSMSLEKANKKFGIINVHLIDFVGSIFLDKNGIIIPGFNLLFHRNEESNETELLHHKYYLASFMRQFKHQAAMSEYNQMIKHGEMNNDKFIEFRYTCLKGRILMRMRKLDVAREELEKAYTILETKFSEEEKVKLINERIYRLKPAMIEPNWDTNIVDYDEIVLNMLYATLTNWLNDPQDLENIVLLINKNIDKAKSVGSIYDVILMHEQLFEVYRKLYKLDIAEVQIKSAVEYMDLHDVIRFNPFKYGQLLSALFEIYLDCGKHQLLNSIINNLADKMPYDGTNQIQFFYIKLKGKMLLLNNKPRDAYNITITYVNGILQDFSTFGEVSPIYVVKEIYQIILLGIELNLLNGEDEIRVYVDYLKSIINDFPVVSVYIELILMQFRIHKLFAKGTNEIEINSILEDFDQLLIRNQKDKLRYVNILNLYYYFSSKLIKETTKYKIQLFQLSEDVSNLLLSTPYTVSILKNEVIKQIISGNQEEIKTQLQILHNRIQIFEIERILDLVNLYIQGTLEIGEFLIKLVYNDLFYSNFENRSEIPIALILNKID